LSAPQARWPLIPNFLSFDGVDLRASQMTNSSSVVLTGHLQIDGAGLDIGVALTPGDNWVAFVNPAQGRTFPSLAALANWVGGVGVSSDVAGGFTDVGFKTGDFDAAIERISVRFDWKQASLNYAEITSLLTVKALRLKVALRLPQIEISGTLQDNQPVKVKD